MTTSPFAAPAHPGAAGHPATHTSIPARRLGRKFVPAPVHTGAVRAPEPQDDQQTVADAVLELLRSVNAHGRQA